MPSWNIHVAQTECLLDRMSDLSRAVSSRNAFLFGNLVPDIFVGYMVPDVDHLIPYRITHFADPVPIPKPHEEEFWNEYVVPALEGAPSSGPGCGGASASPAALESAALEPSAPEPAPGVVPVLPAALEPVPGVVPVLSAAPEPAPAYAAVAVRDMVLGAWVHLLADNTWNMRTNEYLDRIGGQPGEEFRIKKQADFDVFGKTLHIEAVPEKTPELLEAARMFPQYSIDEDAVEKTIASVGAIVRANPGEPHHVPYRLLTDEFFDVVFAESIERSERLFSERTRA